jgi:hypothetical protein
MNIPSFTVMQVQLLVVFFVAPSTGLEIMVI